MRGGYFNEFEIDHAPRDGVIRLARFMGVAPVRGEHETDDEYWLRCKQSILRKDRQLNPPKPKGAWSI